MHLFALAAMLAYNDGAQRTMHVVMGILVGLGLLVAIVVTVTVWREHEREDTQGNGMPTGPAPAASSGVDTPAAGPPQ